MQKVPNQENFYDIMVQEIWRKEGNYFNTIVGLGL